LRINNFTDSVKPWKQLNFDPSKFLASYMVHVGDLQTVCINCILQPIYYDVSVILLYNVGYYYIRTNIGEELNLENRQIVMQSPNLNLTNIFFYSISFMTLVTFEWYDFTKSISRQIHIFNKLPNIISTNICSYTVFLHTFFKNAYIDNKLYQIIAPCLKYVHTVCVHVWVC